MDKTELPKGAISFSKTLEDGTTVLLKATKRKRAAAKQVEQEEPKSEPAPENSDDE